MHETASSVLTAWSNFYIIIGSSAAALTGLMFVVVTLIAGQRSRSSSDAHEGTGTFSSPTVVHFCAAFLVAGILSAPWQSLVQVAALIGLTGFFGILFMVVVTYRTMRLTVYHPLPEDWAWYTILPFVAYIAIAVAGALLLIFPAAPFALAGATMLLIFIGIHNAWDIVTYIAILQPQDPDDPPSSIK
jgi:hypothetical protein